MLHACSDECTAYHVAIVGSSTLDPDQEAAAWELVWMIVFYYRTLQDQGLNPRSGGISIVSGRSPKGGVDIMAARAAEGLGLELLEFPPKNNRWRPEGFEERNLLIARRCDRLYRIATRDGKTYGSGWTADRAEEMGKRVRRFYV